MTVREALMHHLALLESSSGRISAQQGKQDTRITFTANVVKPIFPHEMASRNRAPDSDPSCSGAVVMYTAASSRLCIGSTK